MANTNTALSKREMKRIFRRHRGTQAQISRELDIKENSLSMWLKGHFQSPRIYDACKSKALALLAEERGRVGAA